MAHLRSSGIRHGSKQWAGEIKEYLYKPPSQDVSDSSSEKSSGQAIQGAEQDPYSKDRTESPAEASTHTVMASEGSLVIVDADV